MELPKVIKKSYHYIVSVFRIPYHLNTILKISRLPRSENGYVVISPSLTLSGAPLLSKAIYDNINDRSNSDCLLMSIYGGELKDKKDWDAINLLGCNIYFINSIIVKMLIHKGYYRFICNSVVSALLAKNISSNGGKVISIIHEMASVIKSFGLGSSISKISSCSEVVLFSSSATFNDFRGFLPQGNNFPYEFLKQGVYNLNIVDNYGKKSEIRRKVRCLHNIPSDRKVVLGIGNDLERKGFGYFQQLSELNKESDFIWIGNNEIIKSFLSDNLFNLPMVELKSTFELFFMSDIFFLSSIEDPFPSVILEAMLSGLPVISLKGSGGADEIVNSSNGIRIERNNLDEASEFIKGVTLQTLKEFEVGNHNYINENYSITVYVTSILQFFEE